MHRLILPLALVCAPTLAAAQLAPVSPYDDEYAEYDPSSYDWDATVDFETDFDDGQLDHDAPDEDYVWVDGYVLQDGTQVEGFYRPRNIDGYRWEPRAYRNGVWVGGHYAPVRLQPSHVWEPGFRGPDGYWVVGYQRPMHRPGYRWVSGGWSNGRMTHGYWIPVANRRGYVWEPGFWAVDGTWVDGFWRPKRRNDMRWVPGQWRYGRWVPGHWRPVRDRAGYVWTGGYYGPKGWVDGTWRPSKRAGYYWVDGRWTPRGWVAGHWVRGAKPKVVRRHRVRHVRHVMDSRRGYVRTWRDGKIVQRHPRGAKRNVRSDKRLERRDQQRQRPRQHEQRQQRPRQHEQRQQRPRQHEQRQQRPRQHEQRQQRTRQHEQRQQRPRQNEQRQQRPRQHEQRQQRPRQNEQRPRQNERGQRNR